MNTHKHDDTRTAFSDTTEEHYHDMLDVLPPAWYGEHGFLVGEPVLHRPCRVSGQYAPAYDAYVTYNGQYRVSNEPMTLREFQAVTLKDVFTVIP